jgi:hypothetical protein
MKQEYPNLSYPDKIPVAPENIFYIGNDGRDYQTYEALQAANNAYAASNLQKITKVQIDKV